MEQLVLNEIIKGNIDVLVITETWLSDTQDDAHWIQASDLNKEPLTCQTYSRVGQERRWSSPSVQVLPQTISKALFPESGSRGCNMDDKQQKYANMYNWSVPSSPPGKA